MARRGGGPPRHILEKSGSRSSRNAAPASRFAGAAGEARAFLVLLARAPGASRFAVRGHQLLLRLAQRRHRLPGERARIHHAVEDALVRDDVEDAPVGPAPLGRPPLRAEQDARTPTPFTATMNGFGKSITTSTSPQKP